MEVFIGNLSAKAKLIELHNILGEFEMHSDFSTHEGKNCDHSQYHFVVVYANNAKQGKQLIQRLHGTDFSGQPLDVREYIHRSDVKQSQWQGDERRINEQIPLVL